MGWECASCGPLRAGDHPIHGEDAWHCPGLECDGIVEWCQEAKPEPVRHDYTSNMKRKAAWSAMRKEEIGEKVKLGPATNEDKKRSREILARIEQREARRVSTEGKVKNKRRHGICGKCGQDGYLLKSTGPPEDLRCVACYKQEHPPEYKKAGGPKKKPKTKKVRVKKEPPEDELKKEIPKTPYPGPEPDPDRGPILGFTSVAPVDEISEELRAMNECSRILDPLSDDSIRRILYYVISRHNLEVPSTWVKEFSHGPE